MVKKDLNSISQFSHFFSPSSDRGMRRANSELRRLMPRTCSSKVEDGEERVEKHFSILCFFHHQSF